MKLEIINEKISKLYKEAISKINWDKATPNLNKVERFLKVDFKKINAVILGQDPYYTEGVATGKAFAVEKGQKIPPSLRTLLKELKTCSAFKEVDETLDLLTNNGVLLLNCFLTTDIGKPLAHKNIWKPFSSELIKTLGKDKKISWFLWGNEAKKYSDLIENKNNIFFDSHPSPLSRKKRQGDWPEIMKKVIFK